jgi:hypothetical protein
MKTVLDILQRAGGWHHGLHLHIENPLRFLPALIPLGTGPPFAGCAAEDVPPSALSPLRPAALDRYRMQTNQTQSLRPKY